MKTLTCSLAACLVMASNGAIAQIRPEQAREIDFWFVEQYKKCWSIRGKTGKSNYAPQLSIDLGRDGSLVKTPVLRIPASTAEEVALADSAIRSVLRCNPLNVPKHFLQHYELWRYLTIRFAPVPIP